MNYAQLEDDIVARLAPIVTAGHQVEAMPAYEALNTKLGHEGRITVQVGMAKGDIEDIQSQSSTSNQYEDVYVEVIIRSKRLRSNNGEAGVYDLSELARKLLMGWRSSQSWMPFVFVDLAPLSPENIVGSVFNYSLRMKTRAMLMAEEDPDVSVLVEQITILPNSVTGPLIPTAELFASAYSVLTSGDQITLAWITDNAYEVEISGGGLGEVVEVGSATVTITTDTTFVLTATRGTEVATVSLEVTVGTSCADATVENSDASYTTTVASGATLVLPNTPISANGDLVINQPSTIAKDVVVRYQTQGTVSTTVVGGEVVVPDVPTAASTLTIEVYSDALHTIPVSTAGFGDTRYIKATTDLAATSFYLYIDNGITARIPVINGTGEFTYVVNLYGAIQISVIAVDTSNGVADSSPFTLTVAELFPPDIAGCVMWINANRLDTYTFNGANVSRQDDLSGLSNNISAPTVSNEPFYLNTGLGLNGLRSVRYEGAEYQAANGLSLDIVTGNSVFIVCQFTASDSGSIFSNGNSSGDGSAYFFLQQQTTNIRTYSASIGYSSAYPISLFTKYLIEVHRTPTQEEFILNGITLHTRAMGTAGNRNNIYINSGFGGLATVDIGDIDIHNGLLTPTQKTDIRNYLNNKWGI